MDKPNAIDVERLKDIYRVVEYLEMRVAVEADARTNAKEALAAFRRLFGKAERA